MPLLLKIAPDLSDKQFEDILMVVKQEELTGLVISNTTISRADLLSSRKKIEAIGAGGLSGPILFSKALERVQKARTILGQKAVIIGVGGIDSSEKREQMLRAGADLIQIYTSFIYHGPKIIQRLTTDL